MHAWITTIRISAMAAAALTLLTAGCKETAPEGNGTGETTPVVESPTPTPVPEGVGPEITFAATEHDFGKVSDTDKYTTKFTFTNTGGRLLSINDVKAACGCTVPTLSQRDFRPGEEGSIDIVFDPKGKVGKTDKYITVLSNAGETKLKLTSQIEPMVEYERMHRLGNLRLGEGYRGEMTLRYSDPGLTIEGISTNNEHVHGRMVEIGVQDSPGDPSRYRAAIELTVDEDIPWGLIYATRLTVDVRGRAALDREPVDYTYTVFIMGNVFGELHAAPGIIGLGRLDAGSPFQRAGVIKSPTGKPFNVTEVAVVETTMPGVQTRIEPESESSYRIVVFGNVGTFIGAIKGRVAITTDVPGEEHLEMRFAGSVKR